VFCFCIDATLGIPPLLNVESRKGKHRNHGAVCTIMVGRIDDWLKAVAEKENITTDPGYFEWAGVAVFKKAYQIYQERGYRIRLLSARFRNHIALERIYRRRCCDIAALRLASSV
jgi:transaldolase